MTSAQETELCAWLDGRFCRSTVEIRAHILKEFGVEYSHSGCLKLLARLGFEYRKPKGLPRVSCAEQQAAFRHVRAPAQRVGRMKRCISPTGASRIPDKTRYGWVKAGSNPADNHLRARGSEIHGALNLENFDACRAHHGSARRSFRQDRGAQASSTSFGTMPPTIKGQTFESSLQGQAHPPDPTAALHLNPIERLWAVMHQCVTHNRRYPTQNSSRSDPQVLSRQMSGFRSQVSDNFRNHEKFRLLE